MATIDQSVLGSLVAAESASTNSQKVNARADQWRKHLEKAYFERQSDAMTKTEHRAAFDSRRVKIQSGISSGIPTHTEYWHTFVSPTGIDQMPSTTNRQSTNTSLKTLQIAAVKTYKSLAVESWVAASSAARSTPGSVASKTISAGKPVIRISPNVFRDALPATVSVKVLKSDNGVHLVIRDTSLDGERIRQQARKLHQLLQGEGHKLTEITLNGRLLWESAESKP